MIKNNMTKDTYDTHPTFAKRASKYKPLKAKFWITSIRRLQTRMLATGAANKVWKRRMGTQPHTDELRRLHLAYGFLRGVSYEKMVGTARTSFLGDLERVRELVDEYSRHSPWIADLAWSEQRALYKRERERLNAAWEAWVAAAKELEAAKRRQERSHTA